MTLRFGTAAQTFLDAAERDGDVDVCLRICLSAFHLAAAILEPALTLRHEPCRQQTHRRSQEARARTSLPAQPRLLCSREALSSEAELGYQCSTDTSRPIARAGLIRQAGTLAGLPGKNTSRCCGVERDAPLECIERIRLLSGARVGVADVRASIHKRWRRLDEALPTQRLVGRTGPVVRRCARGVPDIRAGWGSAPLSRGWFERVAIPAGLQASLLSASQLSTSAFAPLLVDDTDAAKASPSHA